MESDENLKLIWQSPEVVDLNIDKTTSGAAESTNETDYVFPVSS